MQIGGTTLPGFEPVAEAFAANFAEHGELGAAFTAVVDGQVVADLWGGTADRRSGRGWERDTLALIFSGSKGLVATSLLLLVDRGVLDLDAPVRRYWPEFGASGILVRHAVSHQAGLPGVTTPLQLTDLTDDVRMAELLAAQTPVSAPGALVRYHALTFGWLCGELVRRVDGRSVGRFFAEEIAAPLGLELWIGLPEEYDHRVATLELAPTWGTTFDEQLLSTESVAASVWLNPPLFDRTTFPWNQPEFMRAEIPAVNAIGTARSVARLYACLARDGELEDVRLLSRHTLERGRGEIVRGTEPLTGEPLAFATGFELQTQLEWLGPPPFAFGHGGAGGSVHGAWPNERVGFSYVMNLMTDDERDPRSRTLLQALHRVVRPGARVDEAVLPTRAEKHAPTLPMQSST